MAQRRCRLDEPILKPASPLSCRTYRYYRARYNDSVLWADEEV